VERLSPVLEEDSHKTLLLKEVSLIRFIMVAIHETKAGAKVDKLVVRMQEVFKIGETIRRFKV